MLRALLIVCLCNLANPASADWLDLLSPELKSAHVELNVTTQALEKLGQPMVGNTVPELGLQYPMVEAPPPEPPYVQLDLGSEQEFSTVVLIPAVVDFQSAAQTPYAFPKRFRVDVSNDAQFGSFTSLMAQTDHDFDLPQVSPVVITKPNIRARYLRLTVIKLAQLQDRWSFAMAEILVLQGNKNLARMAKVDQPKGVKLPPRWQPENFTDERTPLGSPMDRTTMPAYDALFVIQKPERSEPWMQIDLGQVTAIDEVCLHPLHARQGADVPGYAFPAQFRVIASDHADAGDSRVIFDTAGQDYPNPGNNPVTLSAQGQRARYLRVVFVKNQSKGSIGQFALSEMQVWQGDRNLALNQPVQTTGDRAREVERPPALLTDGYASYGRLLEWSEGLQQWQQRSEWQQRIRAIKASLPLLEATAQRRAYLALASLAGLLILGMGCFFGRAQKRQKAEQAAFRLRLARDMHDEIGSSLAGMAMISEVAARECTSNEADWQEIRQMAHETSDALREVLWITGAQQEMGINLLQQLERVVQRLLPEHEIQWIHKAESLPELWPVETSRQIFLIAKEALTNVARHARARHIQLATELKDKHFFFTIQDDGQGFDLTGRSTGMGLASMRERAQRLGGSLSIDTSHGTRLILQVPY